MTEAMPVRRPSLNALRAFEAVARLGSVTAAAEELGVSHGAVSHHITATETLFGLPLLQRLPQGVRPTEHGAQLAAKLTEAFTIINAGLEALQPGPLKISCSSTIMMNWLLPRLGAFKAAHPEIEIMLNVNYGPIDFVRDGISVAIRLDSIAPLKDVVVRTMIPEEIGPVCSPDYAARHRLTTPEALQHVRRLGSATRPAAWREWWQAARQTASAIEPHESFTHFYLQNQAAACGLGVAITPLILVLDQLIAGNLIAPFGFVPGSRSIVLWIAPHLRLRADLRALVQWLYLEMQKVSFAPNAAEIRHE